MTGEKPLEKLTVKELREIAFTIEGVQGVSAMKKEELINTIKVARGIPLKKTREAPIASIADIKKTIAQLREKKEASRNEGTRIGIKRLRRRISLLKKRTKKLARALAKTT